MQKIEPINTINRSFETKFKEKGSLFIGQVYPVQTQEEALKILENIKKQYYDATHHCYAYKFNNGAFKYSDDGEPSGTAGIRILNAIEHFELTNLLAIVIRYFGGVKLGVGPLGKAYYNSAFATLESAQIIRKKPYRKIFITAKFSHLSNVHRLLANYNAIINNTSYDDAPHFDCLLEINNAQQFQNELTETLKGDVVIKQSDEILYI